MNYRRTFAITRKVLRSLKHDKRTAGFLIMMPIFMIAIFGFTFGGEVKGVEIYVVNLDNDTGNISLADLVISQLASDETLKIDEIITPSMGISDPIAYGKRQVEEGNTWACIVFPENFTSDVISNMLSTETVSQPASLSLLLDGSNMNIVQSIVSSV